MYKVLIVDDEPLIREGLRTIIGWEELGYEVVGSAAEGLDALDKVAQLAPDVLIVDVRMPGMDGLTLIRTLQERMKPCPRFLILSGHADFDYARQALAMRADAYLLKPVDEDELTDNLAKLKQRLDAENRAARQMDKSPERSRDELLVSLLTGRGAKGAEANAHPAFRASSYEVILLKLESRFEIDSEKSDVIKRRLIETYEASDKALFFAMEPYLGLVLKDGHGRGAVYDGLEAICRENGLDLIAVSGGRVDCLSELRLSFRRAQERMRGRFALEGGRLHGWDEQGAFYAPSGAGKELPEAESYAERLFLALDVGNEEAACAALREMGAAMLEANMPEQSLKAGFVQAVTAALNKLAASRPERRARCQAFATEVLEIYPEYRYAGALERLNGLIREAAAEFRDYGGDKQVQRMIDVIRRNYQENLKLESLAEVFNYNSSYLGKLFKNTTGESFNTYLDKVRIEKAKELLQDGMKVYQVAERVGYSNVDYFHSKFRKYVGASPSSYRKK
ncbi:response regulator transcription factor [Cohnella sp. AR92]|uniref:response regulator transcription factor n=1 Tax=Cohnella sp. AR92 TaxID=648716 RepID=UPI000F8D976E|nr:response regulator transcription factor [Cohnella sp. AR92]RUS46557.1 response regulator transcription factor [Cohnella sp. AR92]